MKRYDPFSDLPEAVKARPQLVDRLRLHAGNYPRHVRLCAELKKLQRGQWPPPRKCRALINTIEHLEDLLNDPSDPFAAFISRRSLDAVLAPLRRMKDHALSVQANRALAKQQGRRLEPGRGAPGDDARRMLETAVADELHEAGIRLTKSRTGALAATLVLVFEVAGIEPPELDSLFPVVRRLADRSR